MSEVETPQKNPPEWVPSPSGIVQIYTNSLHTTWTLDDVRLRLGQFITSPENPTPGPEYKSVIEERADVTLSWRNVKIMVEELSKLIANYEKVNGEIVLKITLPDKTT